MPTNSFAAVSCRTERHQLSKRKLTAIALLVFIFGAMAYGTRPTAVTPDPPPGWFRVGTDPNTTR